jgi:putative phosphoesterase
MFSLGIISDIHSNSVALESVLTHLKSNFPEVKEIYCLGDIVGYGPEPKKCLELLLNKNNQITKIIKGNHDDYVARHFIPPQVNEVARNAIDYQIKNTPLELRWELGQLPHSISYYHVKSNKEIVLVHGSPQYPLIDYVYPNSLKQQNLFEYMTTNNVDILILGHTHIPFVKKSTLNETDELLMVNPGSIGQPRDGDPRASYALIDLENQNANIQRVDYDISLVYNQIEASSLPIEVGLRLFKGK